MIRRGSLALACAAGVHLVPSLAAIGPLRRHLCEGTDRAHVALTFDDGPDPVSTPRILAELAAQDVRATFFVLGSRVAAQPGLARSLVEAGHEIAVHGWTHRPLLLRSPWATVRDLRRTRDLVTSVTGATPRWWRPSHGVPTGTALAAGRALGLHVMLWTADGRDWRAEATGESVAARIVPQLRAGTVMLLHDSDVTSAPGSWRAARDAIGPIAHACAERGLAIGPVGGHGLSGWR